MTKDTVLDLPTAKLIKEELTRLVASGEVVAILASDGQIKYYDAERCNPALHRVKLSAQQVEAIRVRNAQAAKKSERAQ